MRRKILLALIAAALPGTTTTPAASARTDDTKTQERHVVASPNPRPGKVLAEKIEGEPKVTEIKPVAAVKARPFRKKRKRKPRTTKPRPQQD